MRNRVGISVCLFAAVMILACSAHASSPSGLIYVGQLGDMFGATKMCAQVGVPCECTPIPEFVADAGLYFEATSLWGIPRTNGPATTVYTNALGRACATFNLGPGVFEVQAIGAMGGPLEGLASPPVAVTTVSGKAGVGIAAAGALILDTCKKSVPCGPIPVVVGSDEVQPVPIQRCGCMEYTCRRATFGLYYDVRPPAPPNAGVVANSSPSCPPCQYRQRCFEVKLPDSCIEQLLFLDPCNPDGAVKIKVIGYRHAWLRGCWLLFQGQTRPILKVEGLKISGYCEFTVGDAEPVTKYFDACLDLDYWTICRPPWLKPRCQSFCIKVWEYPATTLYEACGRIKDGGVKIF